MLLTKNFTETSAYQALSIDFKRLENSHLKDLFAADSSRAEKYKLLFQDIYFDFSKNIIGWIDFHNIYQTTLVERFNQLSMAISTESL